ncbi:ABC transporter ATP-binding protein/permease [Paenibacillus sp. SC116]|uniref:ABC transporter ATP-binding protein n=1 Tax=Paenibacillus sp. SC116 TaxID=2968986 RepID=UPI00215A99D3|nr:ABC transporter ATP-binding protein [Paenibacillus sp. SC116]MCR8842220.1 ABC transporter ATP-binding protein/permease [Paenibacillus sp. SC116]
MMAVKAYYDLFLATLKEVWKFDKLYFCLNLFVFLYNSLQANINIYLVALIANQIAQASFNIYFVMNAAFIMILIELFGIFLDSYNQKYQLKFSENFGVHQQNKLINYMFSLDLLVKEDPQFHGEANIYQYGITKIVSNYMAWVSSFSIIISFFLSYTFLHKLDGWIIVLLLAVSLYRAYLELKTINQRVKTMNHLQSSHRAHGYLHHILSSFHYHKELVLMQTIPFLKSLWMTKKREAFQLSYQVEKQTIHYVTLSQIISGLMRLGIILFCIYSIYQKKMSVGDYFAITLAVAMIEANVLRMCTVCGDIHENMSYLKRIKDFLLTEVHTGTDKTRIERIETIEVKDLTFSYPTAAWPTLQNINLSIKRNEKIAIIGDNAAGKSTLVKFILGLYPAPTGTVYYNGIKQENIDMESLWLQFSAIFQDFIRYELSVRYNIAISNLDELHNDARLAEIIKQVGLDKLLTHPNGIDAELGYLTEGAQNLSGGQWQRIAIARALIKQSDLIVLDEPTSAIDPNTELEILKEIIKHSQDKTLILITHRIGIAANVDKIIVLKEGEIAEIGSHHELIERKGAYAEMWGKQAEMYQIQEKETAIYEPVN